MRLARLLLAQLQPPLAHAEVGVALDDHAAIVGAERQRALERARGIGIERLQLHVAARLAHRSEAIACARVTDVTVVDHPLVARHLSVLRDRATPSGEFRRRMREAAMLIGYEALRDLRLAEIDVETPLETTAGARLGDDIVVIAILRAGLGMVEGFLALMPEARVGHLGMYRDEDKLSPVGYYESIPDHGPEAEIVLVDPMLATGGSAASRAAPAQGARRAAAALRLPRRRARGARGAPRRAPRGADLLRRDRPRSSTSAATSGPGSATPATASTARTEGSAAPRRGRPRSPRRRRSGRCPRTRRARHRDAGGDRLAGLDDAGAVVAPGEHEHGLRDLAQAVLDLDGAVVGDGEVAQHVGRDATLPAVRRSNSGMRGSRGSAKWNGSWSCSSASHSSAVCAVCSRAQDWVTCSRSSTGSKTARFSSTAARKRADGRAARDDRGRRVPGLVDRLLEHDEGAVGVPERGVAVEAHRLGELADVGRHPLERPRLDRRAVGQALAAQVDEHEPELVAQRVEVVAEHVVVERGPAVDDEQRQPVGAAFDHVQAGVGDLDVAPHAAHPSYGPAPDGERTDPWLVAGLVALVVAAPARADDGSLYRGPAPRPGPDILYAPPAVAPQLQNTANWRAEPILVSGASAYRDGEFLYQDFLYDDHGATRPRRDPGDPRTASDTFSPAERHLHLPDRPGATPTTPPTSSSCASSRSPTRPRSGSRSTR